MFEERSELMLMPSCYEFDSQFETIFAEMLVDLEIGLADKIRGALCQD